MSSIAYHKMIRRKEQGFNFIFRGPLIYADISCESCFFVTKGLFTLRTLSSIPADVPFPSAIGTVNKLYMSVFFPLFYNPPYLLIVKTVMDTITLSPIKATTT
jgi:hypothetical protein